MSADRLRESRDPEREWFLRYGDECYCLTRFCYFAFMQSTVFRMAHHTMEYYLKASLAPSVALHLLRRRSHSLRKLSDDFEVHVGPLGQMRPLIDHIDLFERLRYPRIETFTHVLWGCPFAEFFGRFPERKLQAKVACFHLGDFDSAVLYLRRSIVPSAWTVRAGPSELSAEFLLKDNGAFSGEKNAP